MSDNVKSWKMPTLLEPSFESEAPETFAKVYASYGKCKIPFSAKDGVSANSVLQWVIFAVIVPETYKPGHVQAWSTYKNVPEIAHPKAHGSTTTTMQWGNAWIAFIKDNDAWFEHVEKVWKPRYMELVTEFQQGKYAVDYPELTQYVRANWYKNMKERKAIEKQLKADARARKRSANATPETQPKPNRKRTSPSTEPQKKRTKTSSAVEAPSTVKAPSASDALKRAIADYSAFRDFGAANPGIVKFLGDNYEKCETKLYLRFADAALALN